MAACPVMGYSMDSIMGYITGYIMGIMVPILASWCFHVGRCSPPPSVPPVEICVALMHPMSLPCDFAMVRLMFRGFLLMSMYTIALG